MWWVSVWNWWRTVKNRATRDLLMTDSQVDNPWKVPWEAHGGSWRIISQLGQLTRWLARCTISLVCVLSLFLYPHYISSHYPWNCKENFREKTLEIHLRVRDCTPTILYTFLLVFLYSYLSNSILTGSIGWRHSLVDAIGANWGIWRISEDMTQWSSLRAGTWRVQVL